MQQIADWLEKLGMLEYARLFAENRIDFSVLPDLTDQDLEKLGVVLGDRRKLLRAIANLLSNRAPEMGARHMVARRGRWPTLCEIPQSAYAKVCTIIGLATAVAGPTRRA
jgi:SAM domain (Sterile alpha motif)